MSSHITWYNYTYFTYITYISYITYITYITCITKLLILRILLLLPILPTTYITYYLYYLLLILPILRFYWYFRSVSTPTSSFPMFLMSRNNVKGKCLMDETWNYKHILKTNHQYSSIIQHIQLSPDFKLMFYFFD